MRLDDHHSAVHHDLHPVRHMPFSAWLEGSLIRKYVWMRMWGWDWEYRVIVIMIIGDWE